MPPIVLESPHALKDFVGKEINTTDWIPVTQERINLFAKATEDRQWIHIDRERSERESPYGTTIAHGFLTLSLASYLMKQAVQMRGVRMGVNYGLNKVRFPAAVPAGSNIRARVSLMSLKPVQDNGLEAVYQMTIEGQKSDKPCCVLEWVVRHYPS